MNNDEISRSGPESLEHGALRDLLSQGYGHRNPDDFYSVFERAGQDAARLYPLDPIARDRHVVGFVRGWFASSDQPQ